MNWMEQKRREGAEAFLAGLMGSGREGKELVYKAMERRIQMASDDEKTAAMAIMSAMRANDAITEIVDALIEKADNGRHITAEAVELAKDLDAMCRHVVSTAEAIKQKHSWIGEWNV